MCFCGRLEGVRTTLATVGRGGHGVGTTSCACSASRLVIVKPDDWHLHVRDGKGMVSAVSYSANVFGRAIIMPNLVPPVVNSQMALDYESRIRAAVPSGSAFQPLMTCYLTDNTTPEDVVTAYDNGVLAFKLYPAGATTNSDSGVTAINKVLPALRQMAEISMVLCVHGEVTDPEVDIFDREREFINRRLKPLLDQVPQLRVVLEHITTKEAAEFVATADAQIGATITPQHILHNRNALFSKGLRPHLWCLPVLKREEHREAVLAAATSGSTKFFLGTDSAPHPRGAKQSACGCAGIFSAPVALPLYAHAFEAVGALHQLDSFAGRHGPAFYGLQPNSETLTLVKAAWTVPDSMDFGDDVVVPMCAGERLEWAVQA